MNGRRVLVVGTTGSGKSTFAARLAAHLQVPHVELDALNHRPGWQELSDDELRAALSVALSDAPEGWVVDGNYAAAWGLVLPAVESVVWLDYPRPLVMWRVVRRSLARAVLRRELWNGNREGLRDWLRDPQHPVRWAWKTHGLRRAQYGAMAADDTRWHRVRSPGELGQLERRFSKA